MARASVDAPTHHCGQHRTAVTLSAIGVVVCLVVATTAPLATVVLGLILCGLLHHVLEFRYLAGRFTGLFARRVWLLLGVLITGILVTRGGFVPYPRQVEITLGYLVILAGVWWGLAGRRRLLGIAAVAAAAVVSWSFPDWHFVVLTHLHNVLPLCFLWEWSRRLPPPSRWAFRAVHLSWVILLPVIILSGMVDGLLTADPGVVARFIGDGTDLLVMHAPPQATVMVGTRFLTVFALMQTMHYVTWIVLMPTLNREVTAVVEHRIPQLRGWRVWLLGLAPAALLAVVFAIDWFEGRAVYSVLASYHAYLEFPILLAVLLGGRASGGQPASSQHAAGQPAVT